MEHARTEVLDLILDSIQDAGELWKLRGVSMRWRALVDDIILRRVWQMRPRSRRIIGAMIDVPKRPDGTLDRTQACRVAAYAMAVSTRASRIMDVVLENIAFEEDDGAERFKEAFQPELTDAVKRPDFNRAVMPDRIIAILRPILEVDDEDDLQIIKKELAQLYV